MRITQDGKVGIGTTAPTGLLSVRGSADNAEFQALNLANSDWASGETGQSVAIQFSIRRTGTTDAAAGKIVAGKDNHYNDTAAVDSNLTFYTAINDAQNARMRINSAGNVGINRFESTEGATSGNNGFWYNNDSGYLVLGNNNEVPLILNRWNGHGNLVQYRYNGSVVGSISTNGTVTASNFTGNLTGNVTGNVTGNLTGNADTVTGGIYVTNTDVNINGHKVFIGGSSSTPSMSVRYQNAETIFIRKDYDNSNNDVVKIYEQSIFSNSSFGRIEVKSQTPTNGHKNQIILGQIIGSTADGSITVYNQSNSASASFGHTGSSVSSDERTKTNIEELAPQLNENTPAIKKYDQYGNKRVGVVAQDIEKIRADWVESTITTRDTTEELEDGFEDQRYVNNEMILYNYIAELTKEVLALKSELAELKSK